MKRSLQVSIKYNFKFSSCNFRYEAIYIKNSFPKFIFGIVVKGDASFLSRRLHLKESENPTQLVI